MGILEDVMAHIAVPEPAAPARRILVLDDERPIRMLLEKWLRGAGFDPVVAERGEEAVELVRAAPFDAVLCDHRMAGMNGTEVFAAVVALRPELAHRFVFMSGDILNPQLREFIAERGVGLLPKPFDLDTVRRTLESVLD
jgi:two-component system NtrC family sensor kinase